jgi:3-oxoadipate enol-lactonase
VKDIYDATSGIAGTIQGSGPKRPLVLLHSLAMNRSMWTPAILGLFGAERELVALDLPGHGASPLGDSRTIESIADRVALAMENLGIESASVVGVSMGGCVAQALAIRHGSRVGGLGLVDTTSDYGNLEAWTTRAATARSKGLAAMADFQGSRWFSKEFREQRPDELNRLLTIFIEMNLDDYETICHAMGSVNLTDRLSEITCPTAIVVGADDYATPVAHAQTLVSHIEGATLTVIDNVSHLGIIEKPVEIHSIVQRVL